MAHKLFKDVKQQQVFTVRHEGVDVPYRKISNTRAVGLAYPVTLHHQPHGVAFGKMDLVTVGASAERIGAILSDLRAAYDILFNRMSAGGSWHVVTLAGGAHHIMAEQDVPDSANVVVRDVQHMTINQVVSIVHKHLCTGNASE